jgi:Raf kinase inhibitor-like YbhB/YbcL family protein
MSGSTVRIFLAVVLIFHGVGHLMGVLPALRLFGAGTGTGPDWMKNWSSRSALLDGLLGESGGRVLCAVLYAAAALGFIGAGLGLLGWGIPAQIWRGLAGGSAVVSLLAVVFFWNALILLFPHKIGSVGVNALVILGFLAVKTFSGGPPIPLQGPAGTEAASRFGLLSPAFPHEGPIPGLYTCRGREISPPLEWTDPPPGTRSFALVMEDLDTPVGCVTHWVLLNIPAEKRQLEPGFPRDRELPDGTVQGRNSLRRSFYMAPCPPWGKHRYVFHLFALDVLLSPDRDPDKPALLKMMEGHVLASAFLIGTYARGDD